ncbi:HAMP domain-containing sensor histidine kinase [Brevibacillus laterosporus]|uniref:sensor histidine kinase n=1 Tax=Brevibacillus laterosporus TaxID=1465 RepID=UPI003D21F476
MSRLKRRLAVHFMYQFFLLAIGTLLLITVGLIVLVQEISQNEIKRNFPTGALEIMVSDTIIEKDKVQLNDLLIKQMRDKGMWLQIVSEDGRVIHSVNVPEGLPNSYRIDELWGIHQTSHWNSYTVYSKIYNTFDSPYLFLLGNSEPNKELVAKWFARYAHQGIVATSSMAQIEKEVNDIDGYLHVVDPQGNVIQAIGKKTEKQQYLPIDLVKMQMEPGSYPTKIDVYYDPASLNSWVLHITKKDGEYQKQPLLHEIIYTLVKLCGGLFALAILFSIWHGYRYGQPLLLFIGWLERMGQGRYDEVLTKKDRKNAYRKNGKLRMRYRLYQEVIEAFYQMAEKLTESEREKKRLEKTREEWMTGITHDLRTPLTTIQGYGHMLESKQMDWTETELQQVGHMIREKADYMRILVEDFSLSFQLKNNAVSFSVERVELNEFVRRIILQHINDVTIEETSFTYESNPEPLYMMANPKWFTRMLDNLIMNAVKHTPPGTMVTVMTKRQEDRAILIVKDEGLGMDEETKEKLFERYYRGTHTEEKTEGSGLGMSIAKAIAEGHHGTVEVETVVGRGTAITLSFPCE